MPPFSTISVKQIQILRCVSYNTARKEWQQIKDALGVKILTAGQLSGYWSVPLADLKAALY
jgi:hypothetical protein